MPENPTDKLRSATGITKAPVTPQQYLEALKPKIMAACKRIDPDRLIRLALGELSRTPSLQQDAAGVMACVLLASNLNLEFGVFGQCYMVPFKGKATFITGWQGWADLVSRSGKASVWTGEVREGDKFDCSLGSKPYLRHQPDFDGDEDRKLLYTYAIGQQTGVEAKVIEVWGKVRIEKHLKRYNRVGDKHYALQNAHNFAMYGRKVPLLQVVKYLPKSVEARVAAQLDRAADDGTQNLTIDSAGSILDGDFVIPDPPPTVDVPPKVAEAAAALGVHSGELVAAYERLGDWEKVEKELQSIADKE